MDTDLGLESLRVDHPFEPIPSFIPQSFSRRLAVLLVQRKIATQVLLRDLLEWPSEEEFERSLLLGAELSDRVAAASLNFEGVADWPAEDSRAELFLLNFSFRLLTTEASRERRRQLEALRRLLSPGLYDQFCLAIQYFRSCLAWLESHPELDQAPPQDETAGLNFFLDANIIVDAIPQIVWSANTEGVTDYANRIWQEFTGGASPADWIDFVHPDDRAFMIALQKSGFESDSNFEGQFRMRGINGLYRWVLARALPLKDAEGNTVRWIGTCTDIDEHKSISERLQASEILFKMASRATRNVIWDYDKTRNVVTWNEALVTELGHDPKNLIGDEDWWLEHIHPDDRERVLEEVERRMEGASENWEAEYRFRRGDGTYSLLIDRCLVLRDAQGNVTRIIGAMEDVTREREATAQLKASEQRWRTLTNSMSQIAWIAKPDGDVTWFNDRWYEFSGLDAEASLAFQWRRRIHPEHYQRVVACVDRALAAGRHCEHTFPMRGKNGEYRWFLARAHPIRDDKGDISYWLGTNTDITKQLQLTEQMREREEHLRIATEVAKLGTWTLDLRNLEGTWNKQAAELYGLPGRRNFTFLDFIEMTHPDDRRLIEHYIVHDLDAEHRRVKEVEIRIVRPDGSMRWVAVAAKKLEHSSPHYGKRYFVVGTLLDLTDRITVQEELKKAKDLAESANAAKSAFLANMSHEIRTPLGAILGFAGLLKSHRYSTEQKSAFFETIDSAGVSLTRIIDDVLDLSKIEAGRIEIESVRFSIHELLEECADLFMIKAQSKGIELSIRIPPGAPEFICSDSTRIRQILLNLIGNAVKFTNQGSVQLELESQNEGGGKVRLRIHVKDTGIGMSDEQRSRIFQPFTQADNSTTRTHGGTGLGLALSKRLALALGGDITVGASSPNKGCVFSLNLTAALAPLETVGNALEHAEDPMREFDLQDLHILVAEDSPEIQFLLDNILSAAGAKLDIVSNGQEAIQKAKTKVFDAILMDIQMPLVDGYEATKTIRAHGYKGAIIALTAHAMAEERLRTRDAGCNFHLTKPIRPPELLGTILRFAKAEALELQT